MKGLIILFMSFGFSLIGCASQLVPAGQLISGDLDCQLFLMDSSSAANITLETIATSEVGDMNIVEFRIKNSNSLGEYRALASWEWYDGTGLSVGLNSTAQQARAYAIPANGFLTLRNSSPSQNAKKVILRIRKQS